MKKIKLLLLAALAFTMQNCSNDDIIQGTSVESTSARTSSDIIIGNYPLVNYLKATLGVKEAEYKKIAQAKYTDWNMAFRGLMARDKLARVASTNSVSGKTANFKSKFLLNKYSVTYEHVSKSSLGNQRTKYIFPNFNLNDFIYKIEVERKNYLGRVSGTSEFSPQKVLLKSNGQVEITANYSTPYSVEVITTKYAPFSRGTTVTHYLVFNTRIGTKYRVPFYEEYYPLAGGATTKMTKDFFVDNSLLR